MRFIETPVFTRLVSNLLSADAYRALQLALLFRPTQGALVPGGAGLRKIRWRGSGRGKRGGLRVLYYWDELEETLYFLYLYAKNEQGDLTKAQIRTIARLIREELK